VDGFHWRVAAASVRGSSHERTGAPCQDAHAWALLSEELLVAAVADGAGSAPLSEVGATVAARAAVEFARRKLVPQEILDGAMEDTAWKEFLKDSLEVARNAVELEASSRSAPVPDLATTLLLAVARKDFIAAVQIGDGAIVAGEANAGLVSITRPVQGESLDETVFLISEGSLERAEPVVWRGSPTHLAVLTDGLQMAALKMPEAEPHPGFFNPLFRFVQDQVDGPTANAALNSFLCSPRLRDRTDDDLTLLLAALLP
jgi:serine/threonine protein phosphatase PrpC